MVCAGVIPIVFVDEHAVDTLYYNICTLYLKQKKKKEPYYDESLMIEAKVIVVTIKIEMPDLKPRWLVQAWGVRGGEVAKLP